MSLPRMSLHIGDYLKDTAHLDAALHGAYLLLIMHYWSKGSLPDDDTQLCMIARMAPGQWRKARPTIQAFFHDGWRHKRVEKEVAEAQAKYQRRAHSGKQGGEASAKVRLEQKRTNASSNAPSIATSNATSETEANAKQPITNNQEDDDGKTRARPLATPLISQEAIDLSNKIEQIAGIDSEFPPPQWCGAPMYVAKWLREGWTPDVILVAVQRAVGKNRAGPIVSIKFFEHEIAREIARQAQPLPHVSPAAAAEIPAGRGGRSGSIIEAIDRLKFGREGKPD